MAKIHESQKGENPTTSSQINPADMAQALIRQSLDGLPKTAKPAEATPQVGELRMVRIDQIKIPEGRFRKNKGDIEGLARSIAETDLIQPIVLDTDLTLISGERRRDAHILLGREEIVSRIVDIADPLMASIEEDRCREPLLPSELYDITEALKQKMKDAAWARQAMGGRLSAEIERGRADDFLAKHVGISRPTLTKIRAVSEAAEEAPEKFADLKEAMDKDGKVDRHYKELCRRRKEHEASAKFQLILVTEDWTDLLDEKMPMAKIIKQADLSRFATDDTIFMITTPVEACSQAADFVRAAGFKWQKTVCVGANVIRLVGSRSSVTLTENQEALISCGDIEITSKAKGEDLLTLSMCSLLG